MSQPRFLSALGLASVVLAACGGGSMPAPDSGPPPVDASVPGDAPPGGDVARCEAAAAAITCADADRQCAGRALGAYCGTERADVLADDLECIRDFSDATGCRSFADPSGASACIEAAHASSIARVMDVAEALAALCSGSFPATTEQAIHGMTPPLPALSDASLTAIGDCVVAAADCAGAIGCFAARYPEPYACFGP